MIIIKAANIHFASSDWLLNIAISTAILVDFAVEVKITYSPFQSKKLFYSKYKRESNKINQIALQKTQNNVHNGKQTCGGSIHAKNRKEVYIVNCFTENKVHYCQSILIGKN